MIEPSKVVYAALNGQITDLVVTPRKDINERPVAVYSIEALDPTRSKGVVHSRNYNVDINVFADSYNQTQTIVGQIIDIMEGLGGTTVATYSVRYCTAAYSGDVFIEEIGHGANVSINLTINE